MSSRPEDLRTLRGLPLRRGGGRPNVQYAPAARKITTTTMPFTSTTLVRDESIMAIGQEISQHVVGPMPGKKFLDFLPKAQGFQRRWVKWTEETGRQIAKVENAANERAMYKPFIKALQFYCPQLAGVDTSRHGTESFSGQIIKPDFMYYRKAYLQMPIANILQVEMIGEAKFNSSEDPFYDKPSKPLENPHDHPLQTLGQVTSYAIAQLGSQFRTHIFSFLLFKDSVRLMRWDRAGVVVTKRIRLDSSILAEFFWRYSHATKEERGVDTTVKPFHGTPDLTKEDLFERLLFHEDDESLKVEDVNFFEMTLPGSKSYIIGKPAYLGVSSLASRATRTFKAWCVTSGTPVFLKDTWRICSGSQKPEHEIYEKLHKAKVKFVPNVLDFGDISGQYQRTQTGLYSRKHWAKKKVPLRTLQHYRLVLKEIGRNLTSFTDLREALAAVANTIQAHREAYSNAKVLHRDISAGNILIYNGGGLLIDWEMALDLETPPGSSNIIRTGTWAFQAVELQTNDPGQIEHKHYHDLESFYHVLCWISLRHARHGLTGSRLATVLHQIFEDAVEEEDGNLVAPFVREAHMMSDNLIRTAKFKNAPLARLLKDLGFVLRSLYTDFHSLEVEYGFDALENIRGRLELLKSDKSSNWAEDLIMQSTREPNNKWGDTSHFVHEIPAPKTPLQRRFTDMMTSDFDFPGQKADFTEGVEENDGDDDQDEEYNGLDDDQDPNDDPDGGDDGSEAEDESQYQLGDEGEKDEDENGQGNDGSNEARQEDEEDEEEPKRRIRRRLFPP